MESSSRVHGRILGAVLLCLTFMAAPALAQTGMVRGRVVDAAGKPVDGAKVTISFRGGVTRALEVKTNRKGEFIQIGLTPGEYAVSAEKDGLTQSTDIRVRLSEPSEVNLVLAPRANAPGEMSKEEAARLESFKAAFNGGVTEAQAGRHDAAVAKYQEALVLVPNCYECHYNIGVSYAQKKSFPEAEAAFKKALELKADYVEAHHGLANVYNLQRRFDEAAAASAEAAKLSGSSAAGATPDSLYNQGVIAWNAGKTTEARELFAKAVQGDPSHADAHFQLGLAFLNEGKLAEAATAFETYLKLAPDGAQAAQAQAVLAQIKK